MILHTLFQEKIKLGRAQYIPALFLSLVELNDGAQLVLSSFLNPVIKQEWKLQEGQVTTLASIFFIGVFMGSIISGNLSDRYGRKPIITIGSFMQILTSSLFLWINNYEWMLISRLLYGFSHGFTAVIVTSLLAEIVPDKYRGKAIVLLNFTGSIGKMYGIVLASIFLDNYITGNWRAMIMLSCLPNLFVLLWTLWGLYQSPRFLIGCGRVEQGLQVLDRMMQKNNPNQGIRLTFEERQQVKIYYEQNFKDKQETKIVTLFNNQYRKITICLSFCYFVLNFSYFGQLVTLPFIYGQQHKTFASYALSVAGELPTIFLSLFLVDRPKFGRKNTLAYSFLLSSGLHLLFGFEHWVIVTTFCRFFMKMCFQMLYACSTQLYSTQNRSMGFGFTSAVGRIGAIVMPYVVLPLLDISIPLVALTFAVMTLLGSICTFCLPFDPRDTFLDEQANQANKQDKSQQIQIQAVE